MSQSVSHSPRGAQSGFTLIEALVALALLLSFAAVLVPMLFESRRILDSPRGRIAALALLRSLLDEQADRARFLVSNEGETGGLRWSTEARPLDLGSALVVDSAPRTANQSDDANEQPRTQWAPYRIAVSVSWAPGQVVRGETVRLVKRP